MSSPSDIILLLQDANDIPSIRAALLAATHFSTDATVQAEVQIAERRLERLLRLAKLTPPMMSAPLTPVRQQSHRQRMHLLMESRLKKALISMGNNVIDLSAAVKKEAAERDDELCKAQHHSGTAVDKAPRRQPPAQFLVKTGTHAPLRPVP